MRSSSVAVSVLCFSALVAGCESGGPAKNESAPRTGEVASSTPKADKAPNVGHYGEPLGSGSQVSLASVLEEPARFTGRTLLVEGHVRRACTKMGCWMELAENAKTDAPACRVIMKGHAFFVPTDSAGSSARVQGTLDVRRIDAAQVAHMESEGAEFARKAADGSAEELRFVANGVELWRG
ncbi:MAG TPA: DUF4920 domain-containing protein [Polyangiaceae bacterium]